MRIKNMSDTHLVNAALLLERAFPGAQARAIDDAGSLCAAVSGEMASYYAEQSLDQAMRADGPEDLWPVYDELIEEIYKRKDAPALYEAKKRVEQHEPKPASAGEKGGCR